MWKSFTFREEGPNGTMINCETFNQNIGSDTSETHLKKYNKHKNKKHKEIRTIFLFNYFFISFNLIYHIINSKYISFKGNENIITPRPRTKKETKTSDTEQNKLEEITKKN